VPINHGDDAAEPAVWDTPQSDGTKQGASERRRRRRLARTVLEPELRMSEAACEVNLVAVPSDDFSRRSDQLDRWPESHEVVLRPKSGSGLVSQPGLYT
jgi:hypothetical protein